jgi:phytoene synthase
MADDIADGPELPAAEKLDGLARLDAALLSPDPAIAEARAVVQVDRQYGAGIAEARLLLSAFRQDVVKRRYRDWNELLAYCRRSADPVGRFLLRLHCEDEDAEAPADALCTALQILNHLRDLGRDRAELDRIYLPEPWLDAPEGIDAFFAPDGELVRRPALDAALDQVDQLLAGAEILPTRLRSYRLALQAEATLACGRLLSRRLRVQDPITCRVGLGRGEVIRLVTTSPLRAARLRQVACPDLAVTRGIVAKSSSSFRLGMASLPRERRRAIHALYAFCRVADDAADCFAPAAERRNFVERWRNELHCPRTPVGRELAWAIKNFDLPPAELHLLLDGLAADTAERVRIADEQGLEHYCRAVAGTVGLLSVRIFGASGADEFALRLARALQLVNVLRDVEEDAGRDRVYVPDSMLRAWGIGNAHGRQIIRHHRFAAAWEALLTQAERAFYAAEDALAGLDRESLRPALVMRSSYLPLLEKLKARGWRQGCARLRLTTVERMRLAGQVMWRSA